MSDETCDAERFAASLEQLIGGVFSACDERVGEAVGKSVRRTAKKLRGEFTRGVGRHEWSERYRSGFSSRVDKSGKLTTGEVGNKNEPGLVHLLEKGHMTINHVRKTAAFPHMAPAFDDMVNDFTARADKAVDTALKEG